MTRYSSPQTNRISARSYNNTDVIIDERDMRPASAITEEDIFILGTWEDFSGSNENTITNLKRGSANKAQGREVAIDGTFIPPLTKRGNNKELYRQRPVLTYLDFEDNV